MDMYLILFKVLVASSVVGSPPLVVVVHEQFVTASSQEMCIKHGQAEITKPPVRDLVGSRQVFIDCQKQTAMAKLT